MDHTARTLTKEKSSRLRRCSPVNEQDAGSSTTYKRGSSPIMSVLHSPPTPRRSWASDEEEDPTPGSLSNSKYITRSATVVATEETTVTRYTTVSNYIDRQLDPTNRLRKEAVSKLKSLIALWAIEQAELVGKNKALMLENEKLRNELWNSRSNSPILTQPTYASVAASNIMPIKDKMKIQKTTHTVFITSKAKETGNNIKNEFTRKINPRISKIKINNMRTTRNALIIETEGEEDIKRIMEHKDLNNLICEKPRKRNPLMIIYDAEAGLSEQDLTDIMYEQNFEGQMSLEEFRKEFKPRFKTGPRDRPTVHHVVEVTAKIRREIFSRKRLYCGFRSLNVKDYIVVPRCAKCQDLGHVVKHCQQEASICGHCGVQGHEKTQCPSKDKQKMCIPCTKRGKKCQGKECITYKILEERLIQKTNYE